MGELLVDRPADDDARRAARRPARPARPGRLDRGAARRRRAGRRSSSSSCRSTRSRRWPTTPTGRSPRGPSGCSPAAAAACPTPTARRSSTSCRRSSSATGDAAAARWSSRQQCAKCHTHSGEGGKVGPDLTGMAAHPKDELLIHILDPSRSVEGNFSQYTVATADGRVLSGLLASETQDGDRAARRRGARRTSSCARTSRSWPRRRSR